MSSTASIRALARLLELLQQQAADAAAAQQQLRQLPADAALKQANEQLQQQVLGLQQQLDAAHALQRTTQQLLKQSEDHCFEAAENLKSIKNDLADKEYALQAAQRKLQRLKQQQGPGAAGEQSSMPMLGSGQGMRQSSPGSLAGQTSGDAGAGPSNAAANSTGGSAGATAEQAAAAEELQAQITELQALLTQRTAEREAEAAAHSKTQRELAEARARAGDESWVPQSGLYQLAQRQLAEAALQLEARGKAAAALQHERDELLRHFEAKNMQLEVEKVLRSKVLHLQQQVDELNAKQVELLTQKQQQQVVHQQEVSRFGNAKTASELQAMLAALQKQLEVNTNHARKAAEASAAADAARQEALAARGELSAAQAQVAALRERLAAKAAHLSGLSGREAELKEQVLDLRAFVEVLLAFSDDDRDVIEVRRSEAALRARLEDLSARLNGSELQQQLAAVTAAESALRREAEAAAAELAGLAGAVAGLQQQVEGLSGEVCKKQAEAEAFAAEIGEAYSAFEEQRQQNSTLLEQLGERDAAAAAARAERLRLEHQLQQLNEQLSGARVELGSLRGELSQMAALREAADKDCARISADLAACREQLLAQGASIEQLRAELRSREEDRAAAQLLLEKERAAAAGRDAAAAAEAAALAEERSRRQQLQDDNKLLSSKLERLSRNANTNEAVAELEEEISALRRLLKCNVCHTRQKDVIITKCWHMFCKPCINKNLEARHRKCPGCGHPFGAADVKQFFFT